MSPKDAAIMEPQHALPRMCLGSLRERRTKPRGGNRPGWGVFAGCGMGSYFYFQRVLEQSARRPGWDVPPSPHRERQGLPRDARVLPVLTCTAPASMCRRPARPRFVAVHYACQSLLNAECDTAIAGGVTIELPHRRGYTYHDGEILSPDGHCRASIIVLPAPSFGSGVGVVVLRRLVADALADGDHIHAVIKATAINNDGASKAGYLAPSVNGQAEAITRLRGWPASRPTPSSMSSATAPAPIWATRSKSRRSRRRSGSRPHAPVLPGRFGQDQHRHLDTAAGVVSLIKATLALKHGLIPASLGFEKPNPAIDFCV